jgi:hypothetical protein
MPHALDKSFANHSMIQVVQYDVQTDLPRLVIGSVPFGLGFGEVSRDRGRCRPRLVCGAKRPLGSCHDVQDVRRFERVQSIARSLR